MNVLLSISIIIFILSLVMFIIGYIKIINHKYMLKSCVSETEAKIIKRTNIGKIKIITISYNVYKKEHTKNIMLFSLDDNQKIKVKYDPNFPSHIIIDYKYSHKSVSGIIFMLFGLILSFLATIISCLI